VYPSADLSDFSDRILGSVRETDDLGPLFAEEPEPEFQGTGDRWVEFEATDGKVFTTETLDHLIRQTDIRKYRTRQ
jgi:hypothetical protein